MEEDLGLVIIPAGLKRKIADVLNNNDSESEGSLKPSGTDSSSLEDGSVRQSETTDSSSLGDGSNDEAKMDSSSEDEFCDKPNSEPCWGFNPYNCEVKVPKDKATHLMPLHIHGKNLMKFQSEDLILFTENFKEENFIGFTQFGKLYRGKIGEEGIGAGCRYVTIKTWDEKSDCLVLWDEEYRMVLEEVSFLTHPNVTHEGLGKVIGYCCEEQTKGIFYDANPLDTLENYFLRDDITWCQRINVARKLANLLAYLHNQSYLIFNISTSHVVLDEKHNPLLLDFGLLSGGIIGEMNFAKSFVHMTPFYCDPFYARTGLRGQCCDVFSYGVILLELVAKRSFKLEHSKNTDELPDRWVKNEYEARHSIVHGCFSTDEDYFDTDGSKITDLCLACLNIEPQCRPTMNSVVRTLANLTV